jgi:acetoin utilization deacetylase AcuC-like enzyme
MSNAAPSHEKNRTARKRSSKKLGYLIDDRYLLHNPGKKHPESPKRLIALSQAIGALENINRWYKLKPRKASFEELELLHHPAYIQHVEQAASRAPAYLDSDTLVSSESFQTALLATGGVLECVDALCSGKLQKIFAFIRPPGHHAHRGSARGFCLFNNVGLAAAYAIKKHKLNRIAIIDTDVHHGDGTQSCFYSNPKVLYISSHQFPFYPGTGDFDETGDGDGEGFTLNFPLPEGTDDSSFAPIYSKIIASVLDQFMPQLILVSTGFDGHLKDPLGGLALTQAGYGSAAASLLLAAKRCCGGKICFVLEGGYNIPALKACSKAVMEQMEKQEPEELSFQEGMIFKEISRCSARFSQWKW